MWELAREDFRKEVIDAAKARPYWRLDERFFRITRLEEDTLDQFQDPKENKAFRCFVAGTRIEAVRHNSAVLTKRGPGSC